MILRRRGEIRPFLPAWTEADLIDRTLVQPDDPADHALLRLLGLDAARPLDRGELLLAPPGLGQRTRTDAAALKLARLGIGGILTPSIHPAFRESLLHAGIPVLVLPRVHDHVAPGHDIIVDFGAGTIENVTTRHVQVAPGLSPDELRILKEAPSLVLYAPRPRPPPGPEPEAEPVPAVPVHDPGPLPRE